MSSHPVLMDPAPELLRVELDPYADMHAPDRPYRLVLTAPDLHVSQHGDAATNLNATELRAHWHACGRLLSGESAPETFPAEAPEQRRVTGPLTAPDRFTTAAGIAAQIAAAHPDLEARHVVWRARNLTDELFRQMQADWDAVTSLNPGDETAIDNARHQ